MAGLVGRPVPADEAAGRSGNILAEPVEAEPDRIFLHQNRADLKAGDLGRRKARIAPVAGIEVAEGADASLAFAS
jgi:hypothetical protein